MPLSAHNATWMAFYATFLESERSSEGESNGKQTKRAYHGPEVAKAGAAPIPRRLGCADHHERGRGTSDAVSAARAKYPMSRHHYWKSAAHLCSRRQIVNAADSALAAHRTSGLAKRPQTTADCRKLYSLHYGYPKVHESVRHSMAKTPRPLFGIRCRSSQSSPGFPHSDPRYS